jgi:biopolymer transport protein ExbD
MAMSNTQRGEIITGINVTPLVDVVLVLLVVLMVTAGYIVSKAIPVELPKGVTGEATAPTLTISIDKRNTVYLDAEQVTHDVLHERVRSAYRRAPGVRAIIAADGAVQHKNIVTVIDLLRQEGVTHFAINVEPTLITQKPKD